jgi:hypothetical protein
MTYTEYFDPNDIEKVAIFCHYLRTGELIPEAIPDGMEFPEGWQEAVTKKMAQAWAAHLVDMHDPEGSDAMERLCKAIDTYTPKDYAFIVFQFPFGQEEGTVRYASNAKREDAVNAIKAWFIERGFDEDWMRHGE